MFALFVQRTQLIQPKKIKLQEGIETMAAVDGIKQIDRALSKRRFEVQKKRPDNLNNCNHVILRAK